MRYLLVALLCALSYAQTVISNGKDLSEEAIGERCSPANLLYNGNAADEVDCAEIAQGLDSDTMYFSWRLDRLKCEVPDVLSAGTDCDGGATTGVPLWTIWKITEQGADACGVSGGDGSSCAGCDNIPNSGLSDDACGICGGDGSTCAGCDNIPNSGLSLDICGVCGGDGSSCDGGDGDDEEPMVPFASCVEDYPYASVLGNLEGICCQDMDCSGIFQHCLDPLGTAFGEVCLDYVPQDSSEDGDCFYVQPMCKMQKIFADDEGSETDKETRFFAVGRHVKRVLRTNKMDDDSKPQAKWMWKQMKDIVKFEAYSRNSFWRLEKQFENLMVWYEDNGFISHGD